MAFSDEASTSTIPLELLHIIFSYLPRASRKSFASLSWSFHCVLQPRLFEHTTVALTDGLTDESFTWMTGKLKFLKEPQIAPSITFLRVVGPVSLHFFSHHCTSCLDMIFFSVLSDLVNLRVLHLSGIKLLPEQLSKLAVISGRVEELVIDGCEFHFQPLPSRDGHIALPLKYLRLSDEASGAWTNQPGTYWWWNPSNPYERMPLKSFVLANLSAAKNILRIPLPPMHGLKELSVPIDLVGWPTFISSLSESCSGLEVLRFTNFSKVKQYFGNTPASIFELSPAALPLLKLYEGPPEMVTLFTSERPVRHLVLSAVVDSKVAGLARLFYSLQNADRMLSLHLDLDSINDHVMEFLSTFNNLQALSINVESNIVFRYQPVDVVSSILSQSPHKLSSHLQFFSLCAYTRRTKENPYPLEVFDDLVCPPYLTHCTDLRYIEFSEEEHGASMQFSPRFGVRMPKKVTIEMWQNAALGLYECVEYDPVPSTKYIRKRTPW